LDLGHTPLLTITFCLAYRDIVFCGMRNAECGIRTTYNLRNIPHQNFRKIYVIEIPHSAKCTDPTASMNMGGTSLFFCLIFILIYIYSIYLPFANVIQPSSCVPMLLFGLLFAGRTFLLQCLAGVTKHRTGHTVRIGPKYAYIGLSVTWQNASLRPCIRPLCETRSSASVRHTLPISFTSTAAPVPWANYF